MDLVVMLLSWSGRSFWEVLISRSQTKLEITWKRLEPNSLSKLFPSASNWIPKEEKLSPTSKVKTKLKIHLTLFSLPSEEMPKLNQSGLKMSESKSLKTVKFWLLKMTKQLLITFTPSVMSVMEDWNLLQLQSWLVDFWLQDFSMENPL